MFEGSMSIQDLIKKTKERAQVTLPPKVVADLRKVLAANDQEVNNKCRVSIAAFCAFVNQEHQVKLGKDLVRSYLAQNMNRGWSK